MHFTPGEVARSRRTSCHNRPKSPDLLKAHAQHPAETLKPRKIGLLPHNMPENRSTPGRTQPRTISAPAPTAARRRRSRRQPRDIPRQGLHIPAPLRTASRFYVIYSHSIPNSHFTSAPLPPRTPQSAYLRTFLAHALSPINSLPQLTPTY